MNQDLISRQAAIDAILAIKDYGNSDRANALGLAECAVTTLPSAQPQMWIPVTEALPNDGVEVWVTIKGHDVIRCEEGETLEQAIDRINKIRWVTRGYWSDEEHAWNDPSFGCPLIVKPIAWMPINRPEPYEPQKSEVKK